MSAMTIFYQQCPICGRNLRVPVKYFGRPMSCTHCEGEFIAGKEEVRPSPAADTGIVPAVNGLLDPSAFGQPQLGEV